jgi:hypothetical protein
VTTETRDQRMDRLEAENARLAAEIDALKAEKSAPRPPAPRRLQEEGVVTISYPGDYPIPMPSTGEYEKLLAIVERAGYVPRFDGDWERRDFLRGFVGAFEVIATLRRLDGVDLRRSASDWAQEAERWLSQRGTPATCTNGAFWAAMAAAGDVPYCLAEWAGRDSGARWPHPRQQCAPGAAGMARGAGARQATCAAAHASTATSASGLLSGARMTRTNSKLSPTRRSKR